MASVGLETPPESKAVNYRPYGDTVATFAFALLIILIVVITPLVVLYDKLPRPGLQHRQRGHDDF